MGRKSSEVTSGGGQITEFQFSNQETEDEVIQARHNASSISFGHTGFVFMQGDISAVMQAILDAPIGADRCRATAEGAISSLDKLVKP